MKKKDAMKWINELRSGKYKQGKNCLYNPKTNAYCCLGVLDKINPEKNLSWGNNICLNNYENIGLSSEHGYLQQLGVSLAHLNDGNNDMDIAPLTFDEIADIIQICYIEGF